MMYSPALLAGSPAAWGGGGEGPLNIALVCGSTGHASATNTKAALEAHSHTVTLIDDAVIGSTDFSSYDLLVMVRNSGDSGTAASATVASALRTLIDGGKPALVGATFEGVIPGFSRTSLATLMDMAGTFETVIDTQGNTELDITDNSHAITAGYDLGAITVYSSGNYVSAVDTGQSFVGSSLADGDPDGSIAGQDAMIAIEAGTDDLLASPIGARVVIGDLPYGGQSAYTTDGAALLNRMAQWAARNI